MMYFGDPQLESDATALDIVATINTFGARALTSNRKLHINPHVTYFLTKSKIKENYVHWTAKLVNFVDVDFFLVLGGLFQ